MNAFVTGSTYTYKSVCDSKAVFSISVVSRTAKTIKTECGKTLRINVYEGVEFVRPEGNYSMCPIARADRS